MLNNPQGVKDELEKGSAGIYKNLHQDEIDKLIERSDSRMTVLKRLQEQQKTANEVKTRFTVINDIASGKIDLNNAEGIIRKLSIEDPDLGEAVKKAIDSQGNYFPEEADNQSFQDLVKDIFDASSQEEISKFLISSLAKTGKDISRDRLAILVSAAQGRSKVLPVSKKDTGNKIDDVKQTEIDSSVKSLLSFAINPVMSTANMVTSFFKGLANGLPTKEAHTEAIRAEVQRTNPESVKYKVDDIITLPSGQLFQITGFTVTGSPKGKIISAKRNSNPTTAK
jgi:hypothetical protein